MYIEMKFSLRDTFRKIVAPAVIAAPLLVGTGAALAQDAINETAIQNTSEVAVSAQNAVGTFGFGGFTFAAPWVLLGLGALPFVWRMLRSMPQKPRDEILPTIRFLKDISVENKHPDDMPIWQKTLLISVLGAAIIGMAGPEFDNVDDVEGQGPLVLVTDNDWASASDWAGIKREQNYIIDQAEGDNRQLYILATAPDQNDLPLRMLGPLTPDEARRTLAEIKPQPWSVDREEAIEAINSLELSSDAPVYWLSNGIEDPLAQQFIEELKELGRLTIVENSEDVTSYLIRPPTINANVFTVDVDRPDTDGASTITLTASDQGGNPLAQADLTFEGGAKTGQAVFEMPAELRNQIARISIDGENTAGATILMDERYRSRPVGLIRHTDSTSTVQALLDESNYVEQAIDPYTSLRQGNIDDLLETPLSVMILTDGVRLSSEDKQKLSDWVEQGGTLLRFAGPHLAAEAGDHDDLLPVEIREGTKSFGNTLRESQPGKIAPFVEGTPFYGLDQSENITIKREVIAQPGIDTEQNTWASLTDGTPFVTGARQGEGWVVLIHTTADTNWTNLPLSQLFIDMMRSVVAQSQGVIGDQKDLQGSFKPTSLLDGFGQLRGASAVSEALTPEDIKNGTIDPSTPPGLYGEGSVRYAHNLASSIDELEALDKPAGVNSRTYHNEGSQTDMKPALLAAAFILAMAEVLSRLKQQGMLSAPSAARRRKTQPELPQVKKGGPNIG